MALRSTGARAWRRTAFAALLLFSGVQPVLKSAEAAPNPLADMAGSWSGTGTIKLASGDNERIRCRATYTLGNNGRSVQQDLRCASDSYKFDVESDFSYNADAGIVSGTWAETNYATGGFFTGTVSGGSINARVEGRSFKATVAVNTSGDQQSVTIRPQGTDVTEVAVTMQRTG